MNLNNPLIYLINFVIIFVIGFFLGRFLKGRGRIRCDLARWSLSFFKQDGMGGRGRCNYEQAESGEYRIELDFFNEKDVQTALKNPSLLFIKKNRKKHEKALSYKQQDVLGAVEGINLPSRELVPYGWGGYIRGYDLAMIMESDRAYFVGYLPNGRKMKKLIIKEPLYSLLKDHYRESVWIEK